MENPGHFSAEINTLGAALDDLRSFDRRPGDFGVEFVGPLLLPIVVEAARQLWASYLKGLTDKGGAQLATMTVEAVKGLIKHIWSQEKNLSSRYAALLRAEAERQGLPTDQIERLVRTVSGPALEEELGKL